MSKDSTQVLSPDANCEILFGPEGTALPTSAGATLTGFESAGYLEDPPDFAPDRPTKDIEAWNADDPIRTLIEKSNLEVTLKFQQTNAISHDFYWGDGTWTSDGSGGAVWTPTSGDVVKAGILSLTDGDKVLLIAMSRLSVSKVGKMNLERAAAISYEVTLKRLTGTFKQLYSWVPSGVTVA